MIEATPFDPHWFFENPDSTHARELKTWLQDYLGKTVEDVTGIEATVDMLKLPPDGAWERRKPGDFMHFCLTFADGQHAYKTFRTSVSIAREMLHD